MRREEAVARLEMEVQAMEQAVNNLYIQAAKDLLRQAEKAGKRADTLTDALIDKKRQLAGLRGDIRCPFCQTINLRTNRFCGFCGKKLTRHRKEKI